jgi:hypothetical protein
VIDAYPEVHQQGSLGITNWAQVLCELAGAADSATTVDVGLQVAADGRIWLCVNGLAFVRFKPGMAQMVVNA